MIVRLSYIATDKVTLYINYQCERSVSHNSPAVHDIYLCTLLVIVWYITLYIEVVAI